MPYRGKIAKIESYKNVIVAALFILFFIISIWVGISSSNWIWTAFIITLYCCLAAMVIYGLKFLYSKALRESHILLSIFCRAENNRHYLKFGLEVRPGYLAKWIEVSVINI